MITLSQTAFQDYVPAFRDSEPRTYEAILPYMERYLRRAVDALHVPDGFADIQLLEAYVYRSAAYDALPHVDLVLTESGFAVVSNQNLAPASRDRVDRLREQLRIEKSDDRDLLLLSIAQYGPWREEYGMQLRDTLLWCPLLCRRHGITSDSGQPVYEEEFSALLMRIHRAQHLAASMISVEQMDWLLLHQDAIDRADMRAGLCYRARNLMAAAVMERRDAVRRLTESVQDYLHRFADDLPEYRASRKYEADHFRGYENKKEDNCYFFGV